MSAPSPAKPRVFVILDTSSSMAQAPDFSSTGTVFGGEDTNPDVGMPATNCHSKFCIAKQTMWDVLNGYVQDKVRIALASYYQYLIRYDPVDGRTTRCWYDAMWKPGQPLYFPNTGAYGFAETMRIPSASWPNHDLSGLPSSNHQLCQSNAASKYTLSEETSPGGTAQTCTLYSFKSDPGGTATVGPGTLPSSSGCGTALTYAASYQANDGVVLKYRVPPASSCPAPVAPAADYSPITPPSLVAVAGTGVGSNATTCPASGPVASPCWVAGRAPWDNLSAPSDSSASCTSAFPCNTYSATFGGGTVSNSQKEWLGYFGGNCSGVNQPTAANVGDSSATVGKCPVETATPNAAFYDASRVDSPVSSVSSVYMHDSTNCHGLPVATELRITDNSPISNYIGATPTPSVAAAVGGYTVAPTPPPNGACGPNWPCDITLTDRSDGGTDWSTGVDVNDCTPSTYVQCSPAASVPVNLLKTGGACPDLAAAPTTITPPGTWQVSPACGPGDARCTFTDNGQTGPLVMPACATPVTVWNGAMPADCSYGGLGPVAYVPSGPAVSFNVYKDLPTGSSCTDTNTSAGGYAGVTGADVLALATCGNSVNCLLAGASGASSPNVETSSSTTSLTPPDASWTSPIDTPTGALTWAPLPCGGYTNGQVYLTAGTLLKFVGGTGPGGAAPTGVFINGETPEYKCQFANVTRTWSRSKVRCSYTITRNVFTNPGTVVWCQYNLARQLKQTGNPVLTCTYSARVRKFDFTQAQYKECDFFRTRAVLTRTAYAYRYRYDTQGGELIGAQYRDVSGGDYTAGPYAGPITACTATWDDCLGAGTTCALRTQTSAAPAFATAPSEVRGPGFLGRLSNHSTSFVETLAAPAGGPGGWTPVSNHLGLSGEACVATDYPALPAVEPTPRAASYAVYNGGTLGASRYVLASDYLDCADPANAGSCVPNDVNDLNTDWRAGTVFDAFSLKPLPGEKPLTLASVTFAPTKAYGLSAAGPAYATPSMMLMPFPDDTVADGNINGFKGMLSQCVQPAPANVTWPSNPDGGAAWTSAGLCMPKTGSPSPVSNQIIDYTPLYGSVLNAGEYIRRTFDADSKIDCRKYFVVLATDGAEHTPANKGDLDLVSAVGSLRAINSPGGHLKDVRTFVVGFGDQVADPASATTLNLMAGAGGTGAAFFAADQATLSAQLSTVLASILQGTYSRSRPVLSVDQTSTTIYASYYDVRSDTPEYRGHLTAYAVDSAGGLTPRWELGDKLDNKMNESDRVLFTSLDGGAVPFTTANVAAIGPQLTTDTSYAPPPDGGLSPSSIIDFVRDTAKVTNDGYLSGESFLGVSARRTSRYTATYHSTPIAVGKSLNATVWGGPVGSLSRTAYATYQTLVAARHNRLLVGASDGLLRSIFEKEPCGADETLATCANGKEAWGYVPPSLLPTAYKTKEGHVPGLDGDIAVEDVCDPADGDAKDCTCTSAAVCDWKTIAVAGLRAGGRGVFGLDITDPAAPQPMWGFSLVPPQVGLGYAQAPVIGRVQTLGNKDVFLAVVSGGARRDPDGVYGTLTEPFFPAAGDGDEVYFLKAATGELIKHYGDVAWQNTGFPFPDPAQAADVIAGWNYRNQFVGRPAYFRRQSSPYLENAVFTGTDGRLYISRFRGTIAPQPPDNALGSAPRRNPDFWRPKVFFDPTSGASSLGPAGPVVRVRRVVQNPDTTYTAVDCAALADGATCGPLPLAGGRRLPLFLRAKVATAYDVNQATADYYVGTGNNYNVDSTDTSQFNRNYFYAVHDGNSQDDGDHDGRPMWVNQFLDADEQVVSEPSMLTDGSVVVATYKPPPAADSCDAAGDTLLYCFNPTTGDTRNCLFAPNSTVATAVVRYGGVGVPSNLVTLNNNIYFMSQTPTAGANGAPPILTHGRPASITGDTRSYRRVR